MLNLVLVLLALFSALRDSNPSGCKVAGEHDHTAWDHMLIQEIYPEKLATVQGVVVVRAAPGQESAPMEGALVELYDHPEVALSAKTTTDREKQKRLAACVTSKDGRFSFDSKPGKYELRCSNHNNWRCISLIVEVSKTADRRARLTLKMQPAE